MKCFSVHSTSCGLYTCKSEGSMSKGLGGDAFTRKYIIQPLTLIFMSMLQKMLPSTLYIM